jgi:hypothetical protein
MNAQLIDRIYESAFAPETWPGVIDDLGRLAEGTGGTLFITKGRITRAHREIHHPKSRWTAPASGPQRLDVCAPANGTGAAGETHAALVALLIAVSSVRLPDNTQPSLKDTKKTAHYQS